MAPAAHQPRLEDAGSPVPWAPPPPLLRAPAPGCGGAVAGITGSGVGGGAAPTGAPHSLQKRAPGVSSVPHWVQCRPTMAAPHEEQKFPEEDTPQLGQVFDSVMGCGCG
jgi:hypothetical protein